MPNELLSLDNGLGYVIGSKMGNLFQLKGDRPGGIERTLDDLEKAAPDPGAVQLFRALYYARQSTAGPEADRAAMAVKARAALAALAAAKRGTASRLALAYAAAFDYYQRDYARALPEYQQFVTLYPSSSYAPIARCASVSVMSRRTIGRKPPRPMLGQRPAIRMNRSPGCSAARLLRARWMRSIDSKDSLAARRVL
jgi:hypothetical protein